MNNDINIIKKVLRNHFQRTDITDIEITNFTSNEADFTIFNITFNGTDIHSFYMKKFKYNESTYDVKRKINLNEYHGGTTASKILSSSFPNSVIEVIDVIPDQCILISKTINGHLFDNAIMSSIRKVKNRCFEKILEVNFNVGKWLKSLHENSIKRKETINPDEIIEYIRERLDRIEAFKERSGFDFNIDFILNHVNNLAENLSERYLTKCFIHGDFGPFNIIYNETRFVVIDFADSTYDSPFVDVNYYCNCLEEYKHKFYVSKQKVDLIKQIFLDGYGIDNVLNNPVYRLYLTRSLLSKITGLSEMIDSKKYTWSIQRKVFSNLWFIKRKINFYQRELEKNLIFSENITSR